MKERYFHKLNRLIIIILFFGIATIFLVGCVFQPFKKRELFRSDLKFLQTEMSYDEITAQIGKPDRDIDMGYGIYKFEYDLQGGEILVLLFEDGLDHLNRGFIIEKDGNQITIAPCLCCPLQEYSAISRSELSFIKEGISFNEVVAHIGEPHCDIGSGVYLFMYELEDGGRLIVGFGDLDYLNQAAIQEKDGTSKGLLP